MMNPPSTFGQPNEAPQAPEPEPETSNGRRTVIIAVAAGVVALGVLGGAAALVLGAPSDEPALEAGAVTPSQAPVEPSAEATLSTSSPLPTSVLRGRNVFIPLIADASDEAGGEPSGDPTGDPAGSGEDTGDPSGSGGGSGSDGSFDGSGGGTINPDGSFSGSGGDDFIAPVVLDLDDEAVLAELEAAEVEIARLESEIDSLEQQLAVASDDTEYQALEDDLAALRQEYEDLVEDYQELADEINRSIVVNFAEVDGDAHLARTLTVLVNAEAEQLDLDPATDIPDTVVLGTTSGGFEVVMTYLSHDGDADPDTVSLTVGSDAYTVSLGASLLFTID